MKSAPALFLCGLLCWTGCSVWNLQEMRSQSPDDPDSQGEQTKLVGSLAVPFGMFPVKVEAVGLVNGLNGTGSDPRPSPQRSALLAAMQTRGIESPNAVLASPDTSLVLVRGVLRPGIQKGDRFDLEVRTLSQSQTTSLRGGTLLETRLTELAVLGNQVHSGHDLGLGSGPVMVDPTADSDQDKVLMTRGRILGGGIALKSRPLALVLKPDEQTVLNSYRVDTAVNKRFHTFHKGIKVGVAKAKTDEYIELAVHPRYKDNIQRYVNVVRAIAVRESERELMVRMRLLEKQLLDPITSARAALQLEAVGTQGLEVLRKGLAAADPEVRFHAAESLAYLDQSEAVEALAETARQVPAFRVFALTALSAMDEFTAIERLRDLLSVSSAETRYGAFRALWAMNPNDALIRGESLDGKFSYHVLNVPGPPMIHVTRSRRPEVVVFGGDQRFEFPLALEAGNDIMIRGTAPGKIAVSRFAVNQPDQRRVVSDRVDAVLRAIVELGGTYPDVVQALQQAKASGALLGRFEVDALPAAGRRYDRVVDTGSEDAESQPLDLSAVGSPPDSLVQAETETSIQEEDNQGEFGEKVSKQIDSDKNQRPQLGFFARIMGRGPK